MNPSTQPSGFTLIELTIGLALTAAITLVSVQLFTHLQETYRREDIALERQQNLRATLTDLKKELRMAGYKAMDPKLLNSLPLWVNPDFIPKKPMTVTLDSNPKITLGPAGGSDMISFLSVLFDPENPTASAEALTAGETSVKLCLNSTDTQAQYKTGDLVTIGACSDIAQVVKVSGNTIIIDTNPSVPGEQGLSQSYSNGTPVGEISLVTYAIFTDKSEPGHSVLKRKVNSDGYDRIAGGITRMRLTPMDGGRLDVTLVSEAPELPDKIAPDQVTLTQTVHTRNTDTIAAGASCPMAEAPDGLGVLGGLDAAEPCSIKIGWNPVTEDTSGALLSKGCQVTGYRIFYGTAPGIYKRQLDTGATTLYTLNVAGETACHHYIRISAVTPGGAGKLSEELIATDAVPPDRPTGLQATPEKGHDNQIELTWAPGSGCDLAGWNLFRSIGTDAAVQVNSHRIPSSITRYTDADLPGCREYTYTLKAVDRCGNLSSASDPSTAVPTDETPPRPPLDLTVSLQGNHADLEWTLSPDDLETGGDVDHYEILEAGATSTSINVPAQTTSHTVNKFDTGQFSIRAVDQCGNPSLTIKPGDCLTPPGIDLLSPKALAVVTGSDLMVTGLASAPGDRSVTRVCVQLGTGTCVDADGLCAWIGFIDTTGVEDGPHDLTATVSDSSGCAHSVTRTVMVKNTELLPELICEARACWPGPGEALFLTVRVVDALQNPVEYAQVHVADGESVGFPFALFPLTSGWYGNQWPCPCQPSTPELLCEQSQNVYTGTSNLPDLLLIQVATQDGRTAECAAMIELSGEP